MNKIVVGQRFTAGSSTDRQQRLTDQGDQARR